jgi:predicted extracellular nuclease
LIGLLPVWSRRVTGAASKEDELRIQQAEQLVGEIKRLREGVFGEKGKNAPVVLIGDYNLVGSRKPLDVINAGGLQDVICTAGDGRAYT